MFFALSGLVLLAFALCVLFFWGRNGRASPANGDAAWQVLARKRDEIEHDGALSDALKAELRSEWSLQADAVLARSASAATGALTRRHGALMLAALLLAALAIYAGIGRHEPAARALNWTPLAAPHTEATPVPEAAPHPGSDDGIGARIAKLEQKLKDTPDDVDGWVLLARSHGTQRHFAESASALERALALAPGHPDLLADLADMLAMQAGKSLAGRPSDLIDQALQAEPTHRKALSLAATRASQQHRPDEAIGYWRQLRATFPGDAPDVAQIDAILAELGAPAAAPVAAGAVSGSATLAPAMLARLRAQTLPDTATLYILARIPGGPPMPVAVLRLPARQLLSGAAVAFQLDDSMAPMPTQALSRQPRVDREARISLGGGAQRQAGDLIGRSAGVKPGATQARLLIDAVVP
jgi:cytochrome c-type biogenesis protein CcmH